MRFRTVFMGGLLIALTPFVTGCNAVGNMLVLPKSGGLFPIIGQPVQGPVVGCVAPAIPGFDGWVDIFRNDVGQVDGPIGPGGPAEIDINHATGIVDDGNNNLYIPDGNGGVRKIDMNVTPGVMSTIINETDWVAGGGSNCLTGIALLPNGDILVADCGKSVIWRVTQAGAMSVFAGVPGQYGYQDGPAESALFDLGDSGLTVGPDGSVYVADIGNCAIRRIKDGEVTTVVGNSGCGVSVVSLSAAGLPGEGSEHRSRRTHASGTVTPQNGVGDIQLEGPSGVSLDCNGNLVIADEGTNQIYRYIMTGPNAGTLMLVAGTGSRASVDHEDPLQASFDEPIAVSVDRENNIIVNDHGSGTFRRIAAGQNVPGADGTEPNGAVTSPLGPGNPGWPLEYIAYTRNGNPVLVINNQRIALTYFGEPPTGYFPPNTKE